MRQAIGTLVWVPKLSAVEWLGAMPGEPVYLNDLGLATLRPTGDLRCGYYRTHSRFRVLVSAELVIEHPHLLFRVTA